MVIQFFSPEQTLAARDFAESVEACLRSTPLFGPLVFVLAAGRMAGTLLFRSFEADLAGKNPGDEVALDSVIVHGPRLVQILGGELASRGVSLTNLRPHDSLSQAGEIPTFLDTQRRVEPVILPIVAKHGLSYEKAAEAMSGAAAILIQKFSPALCPNRAFAAALSGLSDGTRIVPDPARLSVVH